jgi:mannan endo-1,4-beta-mannosidase
MVSAAAGGPASAPSNPNAEPAARAVLSYIQNISGNPAGKIISGQFANFGPGANLKLATAIFEKTGHWPALLGVDYANFGKGTLDTVGPDNAAMAYWAKGGLVTISAHLYNPARTNGYGLRDKTVDLNALLDPDTEIHGRWMHEMDIAAAGLKKLDDAGVVVLWRPFHEMNGGWFWWGGKNPATFVKLWRQMFDYFTETKGLNNLLWVYAPNHGDNAADYYPGDEYVDLVGLDAYTDNVDPEHIKGYDAVSALAKPYGFTEFGPHGPSNPPGDFDYTRFLTGARNNFPRTCFFMSWNARWSLGTNWNVKEFLDNPLIVNLADLPAHRASDPGASGSPQR